MYLEFGKFFEDWLVSKKKEGHGQKKQFAEQIQVHAAYVTQILKGRAQLSLEQALHASEYFGFNKRERDYMLALAQYERAGSVQLKQIYHERLLALREGEKDIKKRLEFEDVISEKNQRIYFSSWINACVHQLCQMQEFSTPQKIAKRLDLPLERVVATLSFLEESGLIRKKNQGYEATTIKIFLEKGSAYLPLWQTTGRVKAIENIQKSSDKKSINYTSFVTMSEVDRETLTSLIYDFIASANKKIADSSEEELYAFNVDLFKV